jgi:glycine/sarcosine N-methyltransferase
MWHRDSELTVGAARGFRVVASDLSPAAVSRLQQEADTRQLVVNAAVADMRQVTATVSESFDIVLAFDNSVPHLLNDDDLCIAFREFLKVLRPGGVFVCSVRDYDKIKTRRTRHARIWPTPIS